MISMPCSLRQSRLRTERRANQALEQTRDSVLRYGESVGCELLNFVVRRLASRMQITMRNYVCPCCGYPEVGSPPYERMGLPPWADHGSPPYSQRYGFPSFECCACCGFEYGFDDDPGASATAASFREYLADWIAGGSVWFSPARKPVGWRLDEQLRRAGISSEPNVA